MDKGVTLNNIVFTGNEKKYLDECIETGWVSFEGPFVERFENDFSEYVGRNHGVAVSSGSAALDIAVMAAGITRDDEVIIPALTIISPALSIIRAGAVPVLVDSDPVTFNMDVARVENKITNKTKAIILVHTYGLPVDIDPVMALAKKYNLKIIEDAAQMHGQTYNDKKCGSFGDISVFSFYANKLITTGEGGMILCDDADVAMHCKKLRNLAFENNGKRFIHRELGFNYRMTNMQAAVGVAQMEQIESFIERKRAIGKYYNEQLQFLEKEGFKLPVTNTSYAENIYWGYTVLAGNGEEKKQCLEHLDQHKIGTRSFFTCMHHQPVFQKMNLFKSEVYKNGEMLSENGFYIPAGLGLNIADQDKVIAALKSFIKK